MCGRAECTLRLCFSLCILSAIRAKWLNILGYFSGLLCVVFALLAIFSNNNIRLAFAPLRFAHFVQTHSRCFVALSRFLHDIIYTCFVVCSKNVSDVAFTANLSPSSCHVRAFQTHTHILHTLYTHCRSYVICRRT